MVNELVRTSGIGGLRFGSGGSVAGQGEEDVVEGGGVHGERAYRAALRVDLIQQRPYVGGAPVGHDADGQGGRVAVDHAPAQGSCHLVVGGGIGQDQVEPLVGDAPLELGRGALGG